MDIRYQKFCENYTKAFERWTGKQLNSLDLDPYTQWRFSDFDSDDLPSSALFVAPSEKAIIFAAQDDEQYFNEIWRDEYESLEELELEWLRLSKEDLKHKHQIEAEAFFSDLEDE